MDIQHILAWLEAHNPLLVPALRAAMGHDDWNLRLNYNDAPGLAHEIGLVLEKGPGSVPSEVHPLVSDMVDGTEVRPNGPDAPLDAPHPTATFAPVDETRREHLQRLPADWEAARRAWPAYVEEQSR